MTKKIVIWDIHQRYFAPRENIWAQEFTQLGLKENGVEIEIFDETKKYNDDTIFAVNQNNVKNNDFPDVMKGHRLIVDGHGESLSGKWGKVYVDDPNILFTYGCYPPENKVYHNVIFYPFHFWVEPSWEWFKNGVNLYTPKKTYKNNFLMPVRNHKGQAAWRGEVLNKLRDLLDNAIYSIYVEDKFLPGSTRKSDIREINYSWFNDTYFSLTLESYCDPEKPIFITEKIFKPLAFFHPLLLLGSPRSLEKLKILGFETFENLFNENYDTELDLEKKISMIRSNIDQFNYVPYDQLTWEKLRHNHNLFFDQNKIKTLISTSLVEPVAKWIEKTL